MTSRTTVARPIGRAASALISRILYPGGRRSSIWGLRCRQTSLRSTRDLPDGPPTPLFDLAPGGVYQPLRSPGVLVVSYTTVSPLPVPVGHRRFGFCGTVPSGCPAWVLPSSVSFGVRTFLDRPRGARAAIVLQTRCSSSVPARRVLRMAGRTEEGSDGRLIPPL